MFILKNAIISITRNKGRNILIGVIILVIACACTVSLAINNTASDLITSYESAYDKEVTISFNRENMIKDIDFSNRDNMKNAKEKFDSISDYTVEDVKNYGESEHIESYYYTYSISLNGNNIEKAESTSKTNSNSSMQMPNVPSMPNMQGISNSSYDFTLNGYSSISAMSEFFEGTYEIVDIVDDAWNLAFSGNYVFMNQELASYNNLSLNDKIVLEDENGTTYEFEIIGIFKENDSKSTSPMNLFSNSANTLITNADSLAKITDSNENVSGKVDATFIIDDYKNVSKVQDIFYEKGLNKNYVLETNEETATAGVASIKNVKSFATTFLIITLLIGGVVLFLINMINIRERKYEIGVLRTIGISKVKLTMQFVSELIIVGIISLMLGAGIGATMSKGISNSLLSNEISSTQSSNEKISNNFFGGKGGNQNFKGGNPFGNMGDFGNITAKGKPSVEAYDSIDAVVSGVVILELLGIGLGLILVSSIASMVSVQRFSPLTILKERS